MVKRIIKKLRYAWLRFNVKLRLRKGVLEYDSPQQEKALLIVEKFIRDIESELLMAPLTNALYIRKENIFIVINKRSVNIINGKYNYDIMISEKQHNYLANKFKKKLEHRRKLMENEITSKVETILDVILNDIK